MQGLHKKHSFTTNTPIYEYEYIHQTESFLEHNAAVHIPTPTHVVLYSSQYRELVVIMALHNI